MKRSTILFTIGGLVLLFVLAAGAYTAVPFYGASWWDGALRALWPC